MNRDAVMHRRGAMRVTIGAWLLATGLLLAGGACSSPASGAGETAEPAPTSMEALLAPGIPRVLAEHRARTLANVEYDLELDVTSSDEATGRARIGFDRSAGAGDLILDFRGELQDAPIVNGRRAGDYRVHHNHLVIPAAHLLEGANRVEAAFTSSIGEGGSAILRYRDDTDGSEYLYTVLVPSSAHALFPAFDQPDLKARVRLTVTAPEGWTVLGNAQLAGRTPLETGERWSFEQTPPIPTYVISFAAGPWHEWLSAPEGRRPMALYARQSITAAVDADDFIGINRRTIEALEELLDTPYPYGKYDMLIAPAFPLGAMEHVGSVYYGESGTLFHERPSRSQVLNRAQVVYHEVAHQWFGNLLTMKWFDDLWLKEGFSTYLSARLQEQLDPDSGAWKTFYIRLKPAAYVTEQTSAALALWQPLDNLLDAGANYGTIVYNKAPSVLRQLSFMIGEDRFTEGLQRLLARHAHGNATWQDLMEVMEEVSGRSLGQFGRQYFLRPGMAEVAVDMQQAGDAIGRLRLNQRPARSRDGNSGDVWPMRLQVRLGYRDREDVVIPVTFESAQVEVPEAAGLPVPDYVWANDGDYGYGRFLLDAKSREWVAAHIGSIDDGLLRVQLWGTLWDEVRDRRLAPQEFVGLVLRELETEQDEQIARFLLTMASDAVNRYLHPADAPDLRRQWEAALLARSADPRLGFGARKDSFDALVGSVVTDEGVAVLEDFLDGRRRFNGEPLPGPARWNLVTRLLALDAPGSRARFEQLRSSDDSAQAARLAYIARAAINDRSEKDALFDAWLHDPAINEAWAAFSFGTFLTPALAESEAERYLLPALERLPWIREHRAMIFLPMWIRGLVSGQRTRGALDIIDDYLARNPELAQGVRLPLLEARDELERTVLIRESARN